MDRHKNIAAFIAWRNFTGFDTIFTESGLASGQEKKSNSWSTGVCFDFVLQRKMPRMNSFKSLDSAQDVTVTYSPPTIAG